MTYKPTKAQLLLRSKLSSDAKHILAYGGARSGKTFEIVRTIMLLAISTGGRYAIFRQHFNAVRTSVFMGTIPDVIKICFPEYQVIYNKSDSFYRVVHNGAEIWALGLDDAERVDKVLGREFTAIYFNECSEISYHAIETAVTRCSLRTKGVRLNKIIYDCNPPKRTHWSHRLFIDAVNPVTRVPLKNPENYIAVKLNPQDNAANLPDDFIAHLETLSPDKKKRFLYGEWGDDNENALWKNRMIADYRVESAPAGLERIVIGVDPAVTANPDSDNTGIVVCGSKEEADGFRHYYVLEDRSGVYSPHEWAHLVDVLFRKYNANEVVAEVNQGGLLVTETLRNANVGLPIRSVRAANGKRIRAEPSAVLYEQGFVHHVGELSDLEDELLSFTGIGNEKSPDRMDALVWALTALSDQQTVSGGEFWFS